MEKTVNVLSAVDDGIKVVINAVMEHTIQTMTNVLTAHNSNVRSVMIPIPKIMTIV